MSLYGEYVMERMGDHIVEDERGFATYRYLNGGKSCYIVDIYVRPEFRRENVASQYATLIASSAAVAGCVELLGSVSPQAKNPTDSIKVLLAYGMELQSASHELLIFRKDIGQITLKEGSS